MPDDWGSLWRRGSRLKGHRGPTDTRLAAFSCLSSLLPLLYASSPPPRGRPIPSSSTEPTSSRTLPHKSSGSAREVSGAFARTTADADALCRHTSNCELCFCASRSTFWGSVALFLFSISGRDSDLFQKTKKSNQIKYTVSISICTQLKYTHCCFFY